LTDPILIFILKCTCNGILNVLLLSVLHLVWMITYYSHHSPKRRRSCLWWRCWHNSASQTTNSHGQLK